MDLPYVVRAEEDDGYPVWVLEDPVARAQVWVAPDLGLNAYRFSVERRGQSIAIIDPPPTLADLRRQPDEFGMPILFPWPGRIGQGRFTFHDRAYALRERNAEGDASHGFVLNRPWQVIASGPSAQGGAVLVGRFESHSHPELAAQYPAAFRLDVTFRLRAWTLTVEARTENVGREPLPVGYGLHPYLRAPLDHTISAGGCIIAVPASRRWDLKGGVPTGRLLPLEEDLAAGVGLEGRQFDDVYTGLLLSRGYSRCVLGDTRERLAVVVEADRQFKEWVVYTPPRPAVCLEPWTCLPNALNLQDSGLDTGLVELNPGGARSWVVRIAVKEMGV